MSIHATDPFATPDDARSPVRRFRGRLPSAVTLWTAYFPDRRPAGLTVSSTVVVDGEPGRLLGVVDDESSLWEALSATEQFVVAPLRESDRQLADAFAGMLPAPGGPFAGRDWQETEHGPVLTGLTGWVGCRLDQARSMGWALLVEATIVSVRIDTANDLPPLIHYRGRYATAALPDRRS